MNGLESIGYATLVIGGCLIVMGLIALAVDYYCQRHKIVVLATLIKELEIQRQKDFYELYLLAKMGSKQWLSRSKMI